MMRILLLVATNLAIVAVLTAILALLDRTGILPRDTLGGHGPLLLMATAFGFGGALVSLLTSRVVAFWSTGAEVIDRPRTPEQAWLLHTVHRLSVQAGIATPQVAIYPSAEVNAFATGPSRDKGLVAVSRGLLARMPRPQAEAVVAHEISHIANGDMVTLTLIQGVLNTFVIFAARLVGGAIDSLVRSSDDERPAGPGFGYWIAVMVLEVVFGALATIVVMWFSRRREYRADAGADALVGARPMADALRFLKRDHEPSELPTAVAAFGIRGTGVAALFASHPPLEHRIAALEGRNRTSSLARAMS
ncbi:MAG: protease HtpX [Myxococcota bacterium]